MNINLDKIAEGAVGEKFNSALKEVTKNILDPNTKATAKRISRCNSWLFN